MLVLKLENVQSRLKVFISCTDVNTGLVLAGRFGLKNILLGYFLAFRRHSILLSNVSPSPSIPRLTTLILICISSSRK